MSDVMGREPAFPVPDSPMTNPSEGMTLRDYFAAKAMAAMIGSESIIRFSDGLVDATPDFHRGDWIAGQAYAFADSMLRARAEDQP